MRKRLNTNAFYRRKPFYIVLIVLFSLLLCADIVVALAVPSSSSFPGSGMDFSDFPYGPDAGSVVSPGTGTFDEQSVPSDSTDSGMPAFGSSDGESFGFPGGDNFGSMGGMGAGNSFGFLQGIKKLWIPILIVCVLGDGFSIFMLLRIRKKEKAAAAVVRKEAEQAAGPAVRTGKPAKNRRKLWLIPVGALLLAFLFVVTLFASYSTAAVTETKASILSGTVSTGSVSTTLPGTGTLADEDAVAATIPEGVEISEYFVDNGDTVTEGDLLASVDRTSVMSAIASLQDKLNTLDGEIEAHEDEEISDIITAPASGRVKILYAQEDVSVVDTMYDNGSLLVLSLDGLMAVSIATDTDLSVGDSVAVILSDESTETGRVESVSDGTAIITLTDDGPEYGEAVTVESEDGSVLGEGTLTIHSELKITGYTGIVEDIAVSLNEEISSGDTLLTLTDTQYTAEYETLVATRETLETQMQTLFQLYQDGFLYADCTGIVSGIDETTASGISVTAASQGDSGILLLANAPEGEPEASYTNYVGMVTKVSYGELGVQINPASVVITDYSDLSGVDLSESAMTQAGLCSPSLSTMVYTYTDGAWVSGSMSGIAVGDILIFAYDPADDGTTPVWIICAGHSDSTDGSDGSNSNTQPDSESGSSGSGTTDTNSAGSGGAASGGSTGSSSSQTDSGTAEDETTVDYTVAETTILSITPQDTMEITITIDELDILSLQVGQTAQVTLDAIPSQAFDGTVTEINTAGSNSGGSTKFTAVVTVARTENMLAGMNASVVITLGTEDNVLTVPVAALYETDTNAYVYTSYDEETETFGGLVEITTGISDGESVEILSGLNEGDSYWYSYLDTVNYTSSSVSSSGGSGGFSLGFLFGGGR